MKHDKNCEERNNWGKTGAKNFCICVSSTPPPAPLSEATGTEDQVPRVCCGLCRVKYRSGLVHCTGIFTCPCHIQQMAKRAGLAPKEVETAGWEDCNCEAGSFPGVVSTVHCNIHSIQNSIAMSEPILEGWEETAPYTVDFIRRHMDDSENAEVVINKIKSFLSQTEKAFGGCKNCYGKGYATTKRQATGRNYFEELSPILPCKCSRGEQIKELLSQAKAEGRKEMAEEIKKQVEDMLVNTPDEVAELNKELPSTLQEHAYHEAIGYTQATSDVLALLNKTK